MMWRADNADPEIRSVRPGRAAGGSDWIGLRRNEGYTVAGINQLPLLPRDPGGAGVPDGDRSVLGGAGGLSDGITLRQEPVFMGFF